MMLGGHAMKMKSILTITVLTVIVSSIILLGCRVITTMTIKNNSEKFRANVLQMSDDSQKINLSSLTSFEWENVYFFDPYQSKKEIFEILGFKWYGLKQQTSEGMMQIIFVNKGKVVCYCSGYGTDNGYFIDGNILDGFRVLKNNGDLVFLHDYALSQKLGYTYIKYLQ